MDDFLNNRRLSGLWPEFAVPDGHDLWPEIERVRAPLREPQMPTSRPGMSCRWALSRAWTAVGILLIAATLA